MDRLRKLWEDFRSKVRKFVRRNWHNDPEGDVFRSLDTLYVLGAVRYKPTHRWQHICWNAYRAMSVLTFLFFVLNLVDTIRGKSDLGKVTWHIAIVSIAILCFLKDAILNHYFESIQTTRNFVNSKPNGHGDALNGSKYREKYFQRLQLTALVIFAGMLTDEIIFIFPNSGISELFGTPRVLFYLGPTFASGICFLILFFISPIWFSKYCVSSTTICSLLYGFKTEYDIFVGGFENILDNVYSDVEQKLPSTSKAAPDQKRYQRDKLFWKCLKQRVTEQAKLHVQLVENMQLLQPIVNNIFGIIYYNTMIAYYPLIYVVMFNGLSFTSICLGIAIVTNLLECYAWCRIVESIYDANKTLELQIMDLMTEIPHSELHHDKYVEIRTMLGIMKTFTRNNGPFSCGGVFPITVEAFTELLNIGYTIVTFLRDIEPKY